MALKTKNINKLLDQFLDRPGKNNAWLEDENIQVYVRKYAFDGKDRLDIATVNVELKAQGRGHFTRFLEHCESLGYVLKIENVLTQQFADFFRKRGYVEREDELAPSFFYEGKVK